MIKRRSGALQWLAAAALVWDLARLAGDALLSAADAERVIACLSTVSYEFFDALPF